MAKALIRMPGQARKGEAIEIKVLISHPMETGYRRDAMGQLIPRHIVNRFVCRYNGEVVFQAELFPAIAANPFLAFFTVATDSGEVLFQWTDDQGSTQTETVRIAVV
jgi:sulfur-oxidizing protein SoxZ